MNPEFGTRRFVVTSAVVLLLSFTPFFLMPSSSVVAEENPAPDLVKDVAHSEGQFVLYFREAASGATAVLEGPDGQVHDREQIDASTERLFQDTYDSAGTWTIRIQLPSGTTETITVTLS